MSDLNNKYKYLYYKYKNKYINLKQQLGGGCEYVNNVNKDDCRNNTKYKEISGELNKIINDPLCNNKEIAKKTLDYCNKLNNTINSTSNSLPVQLQQRQTQAGYVVPISNDPVYGTPTNTYEVFKDISAI